MKQAERAGLVALKIHLGHLAHAGHVAAEHVFDRAKQFQAAFPRRWQNCGHHVEAAVVRRAGLLEHGVLVKFRMRCGVVAPVKGFLVGLLAAVVGERLARDLSSRKAATVSESGQENRIYRAALLQSKPLFKRRYATLAARIRFNLDSACGGAVAQERRGPLLRARSWTVPAQTS